MLTQPTNIIPSRLSGVGAGTVDITRGLNVSWQVNGSAPVMTAFQITVFKNDTASTEVYTTDKVTLEKPFYGRDALGNPQVFRYSVGADALISAGMANGESYKMSITQWWNDTDSVTTTSPATFITRTTPKLDIGLIPYPIASRSHTFTASYEQAQGDSIEWARWVLTSDINGETVTLYDSGNIYGTALLEMSYDGFLPSEPFIQVSCTVQTVNGVQVYAQRQGYVGYPQQDVSGIVDVSQMCGGAGVKVSWTKLSYIPGRGTGSYQTTGNSLIMADGASVSWDTVTGSPMSFPYEWTIIYQVTNLPSEVSGTVKNFFTVSLGSDRITLGIDNSHRIRLALNGTFLKRGNLTNFSPPDILTFVLTPTKLYIQHVGGEGGLYPGNTLYPSDTLYPGADDGTSIKDTLEWDLTLPQSAITAMRLSGRQICNYLLVRSGTISASEAAVIMASVDYRPTADFAGDTLFYADFSHGLHAGNFYTDGVTLTGFSIYRSNAQASSLIHVADADLSALSLIDYAAAAQTSSTYYMFGKSADTFATSAMTSSPISPIWNFWSVIECADNGENSFTALREYVFKYSLSSGSFSNNNTPTFQANFTRYPMYQPTPQNYASGTLSGFIGVVSQGRYYDNLTSRKYMTDLSTSGNALFLKSPKGDVWRIAPAGAIGVSIADNIRELPQTITFPWAEIQSTDGISIVSFTDISGSLIPIPVGCDELAILNAIERAVNEIIEKLGLVLINGRLNVELSQNLQPVSFAEIQNVCRLIAPTCGEIVAEAAVEIINELLLPLGLTLADNKFNAVISG